MFLLFRLSLNFKLYAPKTVPILLNAFHLLHLLSQHICPCIYAANYVAGFLFGHSLTMLNPVFLISFIFFCNNSIFSSFSRIFTRFDRFQKYVFVDLKNPQ